MVRAGLRRDAGLRARRLLLRRARARDRKGRVEDGAPPGRRLPPRPGALPDHALGGPRRVPPAERRRTQGRLPPRA